MKVKIVAKTIPCVEGVSTAEEFIAYAARVSNPGNQLNLETAPKLMKYLVNNQHWSPFEMVSITMEINTTRDIARQILRHRSFSFQEFSQRYADASQLGFTISEARLQDTKNRQNSIKTEDEELQAWWKTTQEFFIDVASKFYQNGLNKGLAKELARKLLPEGLTNSRIYMAGNCRSWIHYCTLRSENGTQLEHRDLAVAASKELLKEFPSLADVLHK